jgi:phosphopantothenate---cysteine ligase (CTP)
MEVIITCGPSYEPLDGMRRITNASTGELGLMLAEKLSLAGHGVTVLRGEMATSRRPHGAAEVRSFSTNDDLLFKLRGLRADAVLHAAALCDFRLKETRLADGAPSTAAKIPTRSGDITLTLEPTTKVLPELRHIFPKAKIVGWKFELDGSRADVLKKAEDQLRECATDGCVVNGAAWGDGFGLVLPGGTCAEISGRAELCDALRDFVENCFERPPR